MRRISERRAASVNQGSGPTCGNAANLSERRLQHSALAALCCRSSCRVKPQRGCTGPAIRCARETEALLDVVRSDRVVPDWLRETLGEYFEINVREQVTTLYAPDVSAVWEEYVQGFGPVATIHSALPPDRREAFHLALEDFHWPYASQII